MRILEAYSLCQNLMLEHGLKDWKIRWIYSVKKLGRCSVYAKEVQLNKDFVFLTQDASIVRNTILHEIAHALQWVRHGVAGHDKQWKQIARSIGCDGERLCTNPDAKTPTKATKKISAGRPLFTVC